MAWQLNGKLYLLTRKVDTSLRCPIKKREITSFTPKPRKIKKLKNLSKKKLDLIKVNKKK